MEGWDCFLGQKVKGQGHQQPLCQKWFPDDNSSASFWILIKLGRHIVWMERKVGIAFWVKRSKVKATSSHFVKNPKSNLAEGVLSSSCLSVCPSVRLSVTTSGFRTITQVHLFGFLSNLVGILSGWKGRLGLLLGQKVKGQGHQQPLCQKWFPDDNSSASFWILIKLGRHIVWMERKVGIAFLGQKVKGQGHQQPLCQKWFPDDNLSASFWILIKLGGHIVWMERKVGIAFLVKRSKVKVTSSHFVKNGFRTITQVHLFGFQSNLVGILFGWRGRLGLFLGSKGQRSRPPAATLSKIVSGR